VNSEQALRRCALAATSLALCLSSIVIVMVADAEASSTKSWIETAGPDGSPYFASDADVTAVVGRVRPDAKTDVTCRMKGQFIASTAGSWWYRLANGDYAPAGDFWNGPNNGAKEFLKDPTFDLHIAVCPLARWRNEIAGPNGSPYFSSASDTTSVAGHIGADSTTQVACRTQGQYVASTGGSWWYRLRSGYYAPAGDFWNGPNNGAKNFTKDPVIDFLVVACS
jgi:hypothetical protein